MKPTTQDRRLWRQRLASSSEDEFLFRPTEGRDVIPRMESRMESGSNRFAALADPESVPAGTQEVEAVGFINGVQSPGIATEFQKPFLEQVDDHVRRGMAAQSRVERRSSFQSEARSRRCSRASHQGFRTLFLHLVKTDGRWGAFECLPTGSVGFQGSPKQNRPPACQTFCEEPPKCTFRFFSWAWGDAPAR